MSFLSKSFVISFFIVLLLPIGLQAMKDGKRQCYLTYTSGPDSYWPVTFSLHTLEKVELSLDGFKGEAEQKVFLSAMQRFYLGLAEKKFDFRPLEDLDYSGMKQPDSEDNRSTHATLIINNQSSQLITIPTLEEEVVLHVESDFLKELKPKDQENYKHRLLQFARTALGPVKNRTGSGIIFLNDFFQTIEDYKSKIKEEENKAKIKNDTLLKKNKNTNIFFKRCLGITCGLGLGLMTKYFLYEYLQNKPQLTVPLVGLSTLLGGLSGYYIVPTFFKR